jgi:hypothetical protein
MSCCHIVYDKMPLFICITNLKNFIMNPKLFNEKLNESELSELSEMQTEILEEMSNCLSHLLLFSHSITCFLFHIKGENNRTELTKVISDIRSYTDLFNTLQSQLKSIEYQIKFIKAIKGL